MNTITLPTQAEVENLLTKEGPEAVHDAYCEGGSFLVRSGSYEPVMNCPHCKAQAELAAHESAIRRAIESSGIGSRYFDIEWADLETVDPMPDLKQAADRIASIAQSGHSALLTGPAGSGKTQAAVLLAKAAIREGLSAVVANVGREAIDIRAGYDKQGPTERAVIARLTQPDLLILDDVGAGEADSGKIERRVLYFVTEARQNQRRATVVTTNLAPKELAAQVGDRVVNRLMPLKVFAFRHGQNFRKPAGVNAWEAPA